MTKEDRIACEGIINAYQDFLDKSGVCVADLGSHGYLVAGDFNDNGHPEFEEYCRDPETLLDFIDELWCLDRISEFMQDANYDDRTTFLEKSKDLSAKESLELLPDKVGKKIQKRRGAILKKCRKYPGFNKICRIMAMVFGVAVVICSVASFVYAVYSWLECDKD